MMTRTHIARAPSNIALIKYMGKKDHGLNIPENPSLSLTLDALCSYAELSDLAAQSDSDLTIRWIPEPPRIKTSPPYEARVPSLSRHGMERAVEHAHRVALAAPAILSRHGVPVLGEGPRTLSLKTANTFPEASGIASSASSFAAITAAVALAFSRERDTFERAWKDPGLRRAFAAISRQGSGSSCRSFEGPWVLWNGETTESLKSALPSLAHFVLLVSREKKSVSSSEAHRRIKSSPLWDGRIARTTARVAELRTALEKGNLECISRLTWSEAWEMHSLFHTSSEPFSYWQPGTIEALQWFAREIATVGFGPIVTMDAGPNIHVTVEASRAAQWRERLRKQFAGWPILEDHPGTGAEPEGMF